MSVNYSMFKEVLNINKNSLQSYDFNITDLMGDIVNISGYTGFAPIQASGIYDQFNLNITNPASGIFNLSLKASQSENYPTGSGTYQINFYNISDYNSQFQFGSGKLNILPASNSLTGVISSSGLGLTVDGGSLTLSGSDTLDGGTF